MAKDAPGMRGYRSRNQGGQLRDKRDDIHVDTIEKQYGIDLDARPDMHLGTFLKEHHIKSLNDLITGKWLNLARSGGINTAIRALVGKQLFHIAHFL